MLHAIYICLCLCLWFAVFQMCIFVSYTCRFMTEYNLTIQNNH